MSPALGLSVVMVGTRLWLNDFKLEREGTDVLPLNENHKPISPKITNPPFENRQFLKVIF